jgi:hypothetical protein
MNRESRKKGALIGLVLGVVMATMLMFGFSDLSSGLIQGEVGFFYRIVLAPFIVVYALVMLLLGNPGCNLKYANDCYFGISIAMVTAVGVFSLVGFVAGYFVEKFKRSAK